MENIKVVDDIVNRTERLVSQFYEDDETVFVFTADHGMSKIGNHGDGGTSNPHLKRVPSPDRAYNRVSQILTTRELPLLPGVKASEVHSSIPTHPHTIGTPSLGI